MKVARTYPIKYKIFKKEDIVNIWRCCDTLSKSQKGEATIEIRNADTQLTTNDESIFSTLNFNKQPIKECIIWYRSEDYKSNVYITLRYQNGLSVSSVDIEGVDMDWVNAVDMRLKEILNEVQTRSFLFRIACGDGNFGFWNVFSFVVFCMLYIGLPYFLQMSNASLFAVAIMVSLSLGVLIPLSINLNVNSVVIDITGERTLRLEKKVRIVLKTLGSIATSILAAYLFKKFF